MKNPKRIIAMLLTCTITGSIHNFAYAANVPSMDSTITVQEKSKTKVSVNGKYVVSKKYESFNKKIASVNKKGTVFAKKSGSCKICVTVKYKNSKSAKKIRVKKLYCKITVKSKQKATPTPVETAVPNTNPQETIVPAETTIPVPMPIYTGDIELTNTPKPESSSDVIPAPMPIYTGDIKLEETSAPVNEGPVATPNRGN